MSLVDFGLDPEPEPEQAPPKKCDEDAKAGPREHPCQEPDCERPAHSASGYTYCGWCRDLEAYL